MFVLYSAKSAARTSFIQLYYFNECCLVLCYTVMSPSLAKSDLSQYFEDSGLNKMIKKGCGSHHGM